MPVDQARVHCGREEAAGGIDAGPPKTHSEAWKDGPKYGWYLALACNPLRLFPAARIDSEMC